MSKSQTYQLSSDAKRAGFFSRKHETPQAMNTARNDHGVKHGKMHRQISAKLCSEMRANRTDEEQLSRLGSTGSKKERARLTERILAASVKQNSVRAAKENENMDIAKSSRKESRAKK